MGTNQAELDARLEAMPAANIGRSPGIVRIMVQVQLGRLGQRAYLPRAVVARCPLPAV
jgi:hypothetical protein